jgi:hypothetical protein
MPCRDDYPPTPSEDPGLRLSANQSTRAACDMRTILRRHGLERELTVETRQWIKKHDAEDAKRIAEEEAAGIRQRVKQQALSKKQAFLDTLSLEERRVLGL